jgi:tRNA pseudouridine65 synthase
MAFAFLKWLGIVFHHLLSFALNRLKDIGILSLDQHMTQIGRIVILTQNDDWCAVNKPPGLSVHNVEDNENLLQVLSSQLQRSPLFPVHRLDKETSGIQILAFNEKAASLLAQQFQQRSVSKFYQGITAGKLPERGIWTDPLSDKAEGLKNPAGMAADRKPCETSFRLLRQSDYFSWAEFEIHTGRQHQIRKHCALQGRALIGDPRYGNPKYNQKIEKLYGFHRMALHSSRIILNGAEISCDAPSEFLSLFPKP